MSTNIIRISDLANAVGTERSRQLGTIARHAAHRHPRPHKTLKNIFRRLRRLAIEKGIWEQHRMYS